MRKPQAPFQDPVIVELDKFADIINLEDEHRDELLRLLRTYEKHIHALITWACVQNAMMSTRTYKQLGDALGCSHVAVFKRVQPHRTWK